MVCRSSYFFLFFCFVFFFLFYLKDVLYSAFLLHVYRRDHAEMWFCIAARLNV